MTKEEIEKIALVYVTETFLSKLPEEEQDCPICFITYQPGDYLKMLPCLHKYHIHCITDWLQRGNHNCCIC